MAGREGHRSSGMESISTSSSSSSSRHSLPPTLRRQSSSTSAGSLSAVSPRQSPKVQLVPHAHTPSFDIALTATERALLERTNFDDLDLSSKDFDFEDIFTYDKPQKKLSRVVEVTTLPRERDWSNFSFSHYTASMAARAKVNRHKGGISEMYLKNQTAQSIIRK